MEKGALGPPSSRSTASALVASGSASTGAPPSIGIVAASSLVKPEFPSQAPSTTAKVRRRTAHLSLDIAITITFSGQETSRLLIAAFFVRRWTPKASLSNQAQGQGEVRP